MSTQKKVEKNDASFWQLKKTLLDQGYGDFKKLSKLFFANDKSSFLKKQNFLDEMIDGDGPSKIDIALSSIFHEQLCKIHDNDKSYSLKETLLITNLAAELPICRNPICIISGTPFIDIPILEANIDFLFGVCTPYLDNFKGDQDVIFNLWKFFYHCSWVLRTKRARVPDYTYVQNQANEKTREKIDTYVRMTKNKKKDFLEKNAEPVVPIV